MNKSFLFGLSLLFCWSCNRFEVAPEAETFFHVQVAGTELPVHVRGNTASEKFILFINGGPGLTTLDVSQADLLNWEEGLEEEFAMVYYDQRGTGNAQGNFPESSITIDQYVLDLEAIIAVIKDRYPNAKVFLMGHSFGCFVGASYLLKGALQDEIAGWISVNGAYNFDFDLRWHYRHAFLTGIAQEELAKGNEVSRWQEALDWLAENPVLETTEQRNQWRVFIGNPGEVILPDEMVDISFAQVMKILFTSSYNPAPAYFSENLLIVLRNLFDEVEGQNLMPELNRIGRPSLFIQGRYDDLIPPEESTAIFDTLGTPASDKSYLLLPASGHEPFINEPEDFKDAVRDFVRRY